MEAALGALVEGRQLRGHYRKAESLVKEAVALLEQVPKSEMTYEHIREMDYASYFAAMIAQQMSRFTEAEVLLQNPLSRYEDRLAGGVMIEGLPTSSLAGS